MAARMVETATVMESPLARQAGAARQTVEAERELAPLRQLHSRQARKDEVYAKTELVQLLKTRHRLLDDVWKGSQSQEPPFKQANP